MRWSQMTFIFKRLLVTFLVAIFFTLGSSMNERGFGMPGGWSRADKNSDRVKDAAKFAVHDQYPNDNVNFEITDALQQVVAGMKFDLTLKITGITSNTCSMHQYKVLQTLDQTHLLLESSALTDSPCN